MQPILTPNKADDIADGQSPVNVERALAERRRSLRRSGRLHAGTKAMLVGVVGAALAAVFFVVGHQDTHPSLRQFLKNSNKAATRALGPALASSSANPKSWLNPGGDGLLSEVPGFREYNSSMLWGTYRPGVYFGFKTRTAPVAVTGGLMWHGGDGRWGMARLRHECNEGEGASPYGWVEHDGLSYGKQHIADETAGVHLTTSMVKPAQLPHQKAGVGELYDVHLASRVEVSPLGQAKSSPGTPPHTTTLYFYIGLDCAATTSGDTQCSDISSGGQGLAVVNANSASSDPLLVRGAHAQLGEFEMEASVVSMGGIPDSSEAQVRGDAIVTFVGKNDVLIADIKKQVEKMYDEHELQFRMTSRNEAGRPPFVLSNEVDPFSNVVVVMVTAQAPFSVDFVVRAGPGKRDSVTSGGEKARPYVPSGAVSEWLAAGSRSFSDRFRETFSLEEKGFEAQDVLAAKAALSNMLGGMGYFTGRSEVRGAGQKGANGVSFEASLFTAVPSRSFFPRGFLWDEGFHQLLISAWDRSTSIDVLGHWLSVLHVHSNEGVAGGWLPREQILGEEARRRVPAEFIAQDVSVANPPTLLLLVESLLGSLEEAGSDVDSADVETCAAGGDDSTRSAAECTANPIGVGQELESTIAFLKRAHPLLDQWMRWLLITQRPGAKGWGGQGKTSPIGAFQWRGRDPRDDRLNALTLASGLDDYPRASHPYHAGEWHVDILCWLALGCRVMDRLSAAVDVNDLPYGELFGELVGGMFDLHWDKEEEAFFDFGQHVSDGELVAEVSVRCKKSDGSTVDVGARAEDVEARKNTCPPGMQFMYPLGNGRGGLLKRRRWRGGRPQAQHVRHIGYVSIFPLLLKLLPPESQAVGSLLAHMRDSTQLWSSHGLRSLSASDPLYQVENNPGDEPYWRGHIWVNVNYLALGALRHYSQAEGPFKSEAGRIYSELRANLLRTLLGGFHSTGYFWEQYDDRSGRGLRSHPFTGWSALVVLIMADIY